MNEIQTKRLALEKAIVDFQHELWDAKSGCKHVNIAKGRLLYSPAKKKIVQTWNDSEYRSRMEAEKPWPCATMYCQDCDKEFGWFCPKSPNGYCEYPEDEKGCHYDDCKYCHWPSERK